MNVFKNISVLLSKNMFFFKKIKNNFKDFAFHANAKIKGNNVKKRE